MPKYVANGGPFDATTWPDVFKTCTTGFSPKETVLAWWSVVNSYAGPVRDSSGRVTGRTVDPVVTTTPPYFYEELGAKTYEVRATSWVA